MIMVRDNNMRKAFPQFSEDQTAQFPRIFSLKFSLYSSTIVLQNGKGVPEALVRERKDILYKTSI
jgi:hypothetical protein